MGVERVIEFPGGPPDWDAVAGKLAEVGEVPTLRMIDGQLALPDERPDAGWQEVRVSLAGGMVTVRRAGDRLRVTVWGSPDAALARSWDAFCWAAAAAGPGALIHTDAAGPVTASAFRPRLVD